MAAGEFAIANVANQSSGAGGRRDRGVANPITSSAPDGNVNPIV